MNTWEQRMTRRSNPEPRLELIETPWQLRALSGRILGCGIYRTDTGLDVRVSYNLDDLLDTHLERDIESAREKAAGCARRCSPRADSRRR